jgi:hypothetical protein
LASDHQANYFDINSLHLAGFRLAGRKVELDAVVEMKELLFDDVILVNVDAIACEVLLDEPKAATAGVYNSSCEHVPFLSKKKSKSSALLLARGAPESKIYAARSASRINL